MTGRTYAEIVTLKATKPLLQNIVLGHGVVLLKGVAPLLDEGLSWHRHKTH